MDNVIAFRPRPRQPEPAAPAPLAGLALRVHLEEAAQTALDAADRIIAALDRIEGAAEPEAVEAAPDPRPSEAPPAAQLVRVGDLGHFRTAVARPHEDAPEPETPPPAEPEPAAVPEIRTVFPPLPWGGAGNVVAAAGCAVLAFVGMRA